MMNSRWVWPLLLVAVLASDDGSIAVAVQADWLTHLPRELNNTNRAD
jgi:hypothetical protein